MTAPAAQLATPARGGEVITINPATGEVIASYPQTSDRELDAVLARGVAAFDRWCATSTDERSRALGSMAAALRRGCEGYSTLICTEMGKPISEARAEIEKCAWACDFYSKHGPGFLAPVAIETDAVHSYVQFPPLGMVLAIMPWNYPFWQVMRFAAPTLMAGNAIVLKHAANVTGCALALEQLMAELPMPQHTFQTIVVRGPRATKLIDDERIAAVTLTGSEEVGVQVGTQAGRSLKKAVLELGGSDAFVVLDDANIAEAAAVGARARFQNAGQSCIAAKRFIVTASVAEEFEYHLAEATRQIRVGDPADEATQMGPMARFDLRDQLADQVSRALDAGGRLVLGGRAHRGPGAFHEPTLVADVRPGTPLFEEETFGPAAAIVTATDGTEAISLANDSRYGLGFSVWTGDPERVAALAPRVQAGMVTINGMTASDPRTPFGGVKRSGYGRELGVFGIREFVNVQTVTLAR